MLLDSPGTHLVARKSDEEPSNPRASEYRNNAPSQDLKGVVWASNEIEAVALRNRT